MATRYVRAPAVLWRRTLASVVLLPPGRDEPVQLTGSGPALWDALARPVDEDALASALAAVYGAPVERVRADVAPVLAGLVDAGAVTALGDG